MFAGGLVFGAYLWFAGVSVSPAHAFLWGLVVMVAAFAFISFDVATWLASPLLRFIDSLYLPGGKETKVPLKYDLPLYYERHFRGEEALAAYEALIKAYPDQINAYAGAIRVSESQLQNAERGRHWRRVAERNFGPEKIAQAVAKSAEQWHAERMEKASASPQSL